MTVCRNGSSHLRGSVYVHYKSLESAILAYHSVNGCYFTGKQITCEFINVTRWKIAICGEYMKHALVEWLAILSTVSATLAETMNGLIGINHLQDIGHHYKRSRSREADRVKSGSGISQDDERQVHKTTWSRRRSNYHSESRSDEANSDGSWSDMDRD
ncbi:hypothetical protein CUMW_284040 [Citrus unshiu]|uniref:RRM domain-containing protein n=1 Tax=Citrus unshiu TaxID=55188 RepID=A0A2H5MZ09_CITUN|nr:hypothetical protein CUMW_284040 [Citrus unshiu]